jgi:hypothetical protein
MAMASPVDDVAAESHEMSILPFQIQGYRSDFEAPSNLELLTVRFVFTGLRPRDSS